MYKKFFIGLFLLCSIFSVICLAQITTTKPLSKGALLLKNYPVTPSSSEQEESATSNQAQNQPAEFKMKLPAQPKLPFFPTQTINVADTTSTDIVSSNQTGNTTNTANNTASNVPVKKRSIYQ
jgi:hypothetical protein